MRSIVATLSFPVHNLISSESRDGPDRGSRHSGRILPTEKESMSMRKHVICVREQAFVQHMSVGVLYAIVNML